MGSINEPKIEDSDFNDGTKTIVSLFPAKIPCMDTALQSLDSLSEQILQFIIASTSGGLDHNLIHHTSLLPRQSDALYASLTLMRGLLMDAQAKFKKMAENNRRLASHIDGTIKSANQEVNSLRLELNMTNQKLKELSLVKEACTHCQETKKMNEENKTLAAKNRQLEKEIANLKQQVQNNENRHKEAVKALSSDRDRLKNDKFELLSLVNAMQQTVDDKEEQLREFLRGFESQVKETDEMMKMADEERSVLSKERNDISRKHQDLLEVVATLRSELVSNERRIRELDAELITLRQFSLQVQTSKRRSIHIVEEDITSQKSFGSACLDPNLSIRSTDPLLISSSPALNRYVVAPNGSAGGNSSSSTEDLQLEVPTTGRKPKIVQHLSGSLSRAFKRTRNRKSLDITNVDMYLGSSRNSLSERTETEKKEILENIQNVPMLKWKADDVLIWLDSVLHMEQYAKECEENIKSGKILLSLTESDFERCLGITDPLHRRKLCLAVDEFRNPAVTIANTSVAGQLDHWWVCEQWLRDLGLVSYASRFREHLIDGRCLSSLTRKDLERYMGMEGRKLHQDSVLRGVELLNMLAFNIQRLDERRNMCQSCDTDLLVWNNSRLIKWTKSIDLKEYSSNLRDSGVHGALIVLDQNFTSEDLASALGIPINKATVRRHLASEFDVLVKQARETLGDEIICAFDENGKRSYSKCINIPTNQKVKKGIRSSISRSFGRQFSKDSLGDK